MYHTLLEPDASGTFVGSSYGYASARDWARFGLLFLNDGVWNGEQILPEGWVKYSTTPAPAAPIGQYGAHWWLNAGAKDHPEKSYHPGLPHDEFVAEGFEDQYIFIIPSQKLVVVRLGVSHQPTALIPVFIHPHIPLYFSRRWIETRYSAKPRPMFLSNVRPPSSASS